MPLEKQNPALGTMDTQWVTRNERPERSGIRGVLFGEASRQLMAGGALQVFIISSGGAADGQH